MTKTEKKEPKIDQIGRELVERGPKSSNWTPLIAMIDDRYDRAFVNGHRKYCEPNGIEPWQVNNDVLDDYVEQLISDGTHPSRAKQARRDLTKTWNRLVSTKPGWPQVKLDLIDSRPSPSIPASDLPNTFTEEMARFLDRSSPKNLFEKSNFKPLSPASQNDRRQKILLMVTILIQSGVDPATIRSLADLVTPQAREVILEKLWERSNEKPNAHFHNLARLLSLIAKHWVKVSPDELEKFKAAEANLRPEHSGMTEKNERRLRILVNPVNIRKIIRLPFDVISAFDHAKPSILAAVEVQSAIAVMILLIAPIREKNLAELDLDLNVHQVRDDEWYLVIPGKDVKNKEDLTFPLSKDIVDLFKTYLKIYRPLLEKKPSKKIFISLNGRQKTGNELGAQLPKFIKKHTGLVMNVHLFRHFAAYLYLKANPGHYEPVRQLLGHKDIKTTYRFYTKLEQEEAIRIYDNIVDKLRKEEPK